MLKDITIGQYLPGNSFLHRLDPRTKILAVLFYMISLFLVNNFWGLGAMLLLSIVVVLISHIPLKFFFRGIKAIVFIVLLTVALQMFMTPGEPLWRWGFLTITWHQSYSGNRGFTTACTVELHFFIVCHCSFPP